MKTIKKIEDNAQIIIPLKDYNKLKAEALLKNHHQPFIEVVYSFIRSIKDEYPNLNNVDILNSLNRISKNKWALTSLTTKDGYELNDCIPVIIE